MESGTQGTLRMHTSIGLTYANDKLMDGAGAQLQRIYGIYALSRFFGFAYIHTPLRHIGYEGLAALERNASSGDAASKYNQVFNISSDMALPSDTLEHEMEPLDLGALLAVSERTSQFNLFKLQSPYPLADQTPAIYDAVKPISPFTSKPHSVLRVAIHVRRGDLFAVDSDRMLPNSYYVSTAQTIARVLEGLSIPYECELYTEVANKAFEITATHHGIHQRIARSVNLNPRMNRLEDFDAIPNVKIIANGDAIEALKGMATADIFMMSRSSFSYVAAILNRRGIVIYYPFWHSPLPSWIVATEYGISYPTGLIGQILTAKRQLSHQPADAADTSSHIRLQEEGK